MESLFKQEMTISFPPKLQRLLLQGKRGDVIRLLEKQIDDDGGLFNFDLGFQENRKLSWLMRIDLLREWNRLSEALAWTCLECEVNPNNLTALALKEQLKRQLKLGDPQINIENSKTAPTLNWDGVAGKRELKAILERDILLPLCVPDIYRLHKVSLPNGVLLYGPTGCGKSFIARKLALILNYNFREIKPSNVVDNYGLDWNEKMGKLFADVKADAPCVLFIDEIEALFPNRASDGVSHQNQADVNEFLMHLNECEENNILVVGATNCPNLVDPALRLPGGLDKKIFVGPPDLEARAEALKFFMKGKPQTEIDFIYLAEQTECYTFTELEFLVNEAASGALGCRMPIRTDTILKSILNDKPVHNHQMIENLAKAVNE